MTYDSIAYDAQIELDIEPADKVTPLYTRDEWQYAKPVHLPSSITFVPTIMRHCEL